MDPNVHVQVDNPTNTHLATLDMECAASLAGKTIFFQRSLLSV